MGWFSDAGDKRGSASSIDRRPKSAKAQSRGKLARAGSECYGDLMAAPSSMIDVVLTGFDLCVCRYGRSAECSRPFGGCWERIEVLSAH